MPPSILSRFARVLKACWLALGTIVLTVVAAELAGQVGYRVLDAASFAFRHRKPAEPTTCERVMSSLTLRWQPYTYWRGVPSRDEWVTVEADGRRRSWQYAPPDSTAPVVAVTGGSAVWGMCVRDDETIPSHLARGMAGANIRARVENHAQIGWVTTQELTDLALDLRAGRVPRVVVFHDGWNDIVAGMAEGSPGIPLNEANREAEFNLLTHVGRMRLYSIGNPMKSALGRLANTIQHRFLPARQPNPIPAGWRKVFGADTSEARMDEVAREVVRVYEWNLQAVQSLGKQYGFQPLFYWQPDIVGKTTLSASERATLAANPLMARFTRKVRLAVRESPVLGSCAGFHNLEDYFDGDEQEIFNDWCHITAPANRRVADRMLADVRAALAGPR